MLMPLRRSRAVRVRAVSPQAAESHTEHSRAEGGQQKSMKVWFWGASLDAANSPAASAGQEVQEKPLCLCPCFSLVRSKDVSWCSSGFWGGGIGKREALLNQLKRP